MLKRLPPARHSRTARRLRPAVFLAAMAAGLLNAASAPELLRRSYISSETTTKRQYFVYLPRGYRDEPRPWPLLLFLHGNGERGNGHEHLDLVLAHGPL